MKNALAAKRSVAVLTATLVVLSGCATVQRQSSHDAAGLLKSAGFIANATPDAEKEFDVGAAKEYAELQRLRSQRIADHEKAVQQTQAESDSRLGGAWNPKGLQVKP